MMKPSFLHARGGVSGKTTAPPYSFWFSPRTWRCFFISGQGTVRHDVFSTHVEVFPIGSTRAPSRQGFLHARGGVSPPKNRKKVAQVFSPRTWRCFQARATQEDSSFVFSTHVEVFLNGIVPAIIAGGFLHARGGVSGGKLVPDTKASVFSTHVEVFPSAFLLMASLPGFLHARGGVSICLVLTVLWKRFSPRTWRCFSIFMTMEATNVVFSTHVEVFLPFSSVKTSFKCFLHARGGVSFAKALAGQFLKFSPRTWRCFIYWLTFQTGNTGFLHARGGVSVGVVLHGSGRLFSPRTWRCFLL